jgi:hypothetical protein
MDQYAKTIHIGQEQLTFSVGNRKLDAKRTAEELGLTEKDTITVSIETVLIHVRNDSDSTSEKYTIATKVPSFPFPLFLSLSPLFVPRN